MRRFCGDREEVNRARSTRQPGACPEVVEGAAVPTHNQGSWLAISCAKNKIQRQKIASFTYIAGSEADDRSDVGGGTSG
ncbi:MAG: hypothetical protein WBV55_18465 [Candidatus Sulfotelmatobacter sp.]